MFSFVFSSLCVCWVRIPFSPLNTLTDCPNKRFTVYSSYFVRLCFRDFDLRPSILLDRWEDLWLLFFHHLELIECVFFCYWRCIHGCLSLRSISGRPLSLNQEYMSASLLLFEFLLLCTSFCHPLMSTSCNLFLSPPEQPNITPSIVS